MKIINYCRHCGSKIARSHQGGFDSTTGKPWYWGACPNYRWYKPWHDSFYIYR